MFSSLLTNLTSYMFHSLTIHLYRIIDVYFYTSIFSLDCMNAVSHILLKVCESVVWGTRTPKRFHPPTVFKTASSSSRIHDKLPDYKTSLFALRTLNTSSDKQNSLLRTSCSHLQRHLSRLYYKVLLRFNQQLLKRLLEKKNADNEIRTRKVCHRRILSPIRIPVPTYPHVRFCKIYSNV